jgi:hypothetical protein
MTTAPINPVNFMQDVVIDEGTRKTPKTKVEQQDAFKQMLVEEVFLKEVYANGEDSIYKPEPEPDEDLSSMSKGMNSIYSGYMKKQMAEYIVQQGFLKDELDRGR